MCSDDNSNNHCSNNNHSSTRNNDNRNNSNYRNTSTNCNNRSLCNNCINNSSKMNLPLALGFGLEVFRNFLLAMSLLRFL